MKKTIVGLLALGLALAFVPGASAGEPSALLPPRPAVAGDGGAQRSDAVRTRIRSLHGDRTQCLDADSNNGENGTRVQVWRCNGQPQQVWVAEGGQLRNERFPGMCLDADTTTGGANGTRLQLWRCNGESQQQWRLLPDDLAIYNLRFLNDFRTVVDRDPAQVDGAVAQLWEKNFQSQQWWQFEPA
ncbi:RICIN domain-containing protein [Actinosynnema sp. NPDC059797]